MFPKLIQFRLAATLFGLFMGLCLFEGALIWRDLNSSDHKLNVIRKLRKTAARVYPVVAPGMLIHDSELTVNSILPLSGMSHSITVGNKEGASRLVFLSDRYGFNNPDSIWDRPEIDLALVGDSFSQGESVDSCDNLRGNLHRTFPATLNLGIGGNGPLSYLATIREYGRLKSPKIVLWMYALNDMGRDLENEKRSEWLLKYLNPSWSQQLSKKQDLVDEHLKRVVEHQEKEEGRRRVQDARLKVRNFLKFRWVKWLVFNSFFKPPREGFIRDRTLASDFEFADLDIELFKNCLKAARTEVESWEGEMIFIYLPNAPSLGGENLPDPEMPLRHRDRVLNLVAGLGIPSIDLLDHFQSHPSPMRLFTDCGSWWGHYNADGYRFAAEGVRKGLEALGKMNSKGIAGKTDAAKEAIQAPLLSPVGALP